MKNKFWESGLSFECKQCGNCCTFDGGSIYASKREFEEIAKFLGLSFSEFVKRFTRSDDKFVSLKLNDKKHCIFYENGCKIYEKRPGQCRSYPFWPEILKSEFRWTYESDSCKGIGSGKQWSKEEIIKELKQADDILLRSDAQ